MIEIQRITSDNTIWWKKISPGVWINVGGSLSASSSTPQTIMPYGAWLAGGLIVTGGILTSAALYYTSRLVKHSTVEVGGYGQMASMDGYDDYAQAA